MGKDFRDYDKNSSDDDSDSSEISIDEFEHSETDSENEDNNISASPDQAIEKEDQNNKEEDDEDDDDDELVKAIKAEKNKARDHPPTINCEDFIVNISFNPVKNLIALANIVGDVLLYEYSNEETKLVETYEVHLKVCRDIEFDDSGLTLYSTSKDKTIVATDVETGKMKRCYENAHDDPVYSMISLGGEKIVTGDDGGTVKMWDMRKADPIFSIKIGDEHVSDMITNDAQKYLVCAGGDGVLTCLDLKASKIYTTSEEYDSELTCMGLFRSDTKLLFLVPIFNTVALPDITTTMASDAENVLLNYGIISESNKENVINMCVDSEFKNNFNLQLKNFYSSQCGTVKKPWTRDRVLEVITHIKTAKVAMDSGVRRNPTQYYWCKKYDIMTVAGDDFEISFILRCLYLVITHYV